jgi:hypothetical protein
MPIPAEGDLQRVGITDIGGQLLVQVTTMGR